MIDEQILSEVRNFEIACKDAKEHEQLLGSAMQFLCLTFGFNSGIAILINKAESKNFCLIRKSDGNLEFNQTKFASDLLELPNWGAFSRPKVILTIEDFETQSILTRQCRKFAHTQELMDKITANVAKTPSVFVPLYDAKNEALGFIHAFWEKRAKAEKPAEFGRRDEVLLTLFKSLVEMSIADLAKAKSLETLTLESHLLEQNNRSLHKELIDLRKNHSKRMEESHKLGMNNVAVGILHNIGNVMNSVSVSTSVIHTTVSKLKIDLLQRISNLLTENRDHLDEFTKNDEVGRDLIDFIMKVASDFSTKRDVLQKEIGDLTGHLEHVKSLISSQQAAARLSGIVDAHSLSDLVEEAINLCLPRRDEEEIAVVFDFEPVPLLVIDKHKVLQILVNLLGNARNALLISGKKRKQIDVAITRASPNRVQIRVRDNGVGIPLHNQRQIFTQGFSTRKDGNGIGLHNCATAAQEMKGKIWCESQGTDLGATFFLELPMTLANAV